MTKSTKYVIFLLAFSINSMQFAQAQNKLQFGFNVSPELTDMVYLPSEAKSSEPRLGFSLEGFVRKKVGNHITAELGLGSRTMRFHQDWPDAVFQLDIDDDGGIISRSQVVQNFTWQEMHIVLGIKYWICENGKGLFVGLGANPTYFYREHFDIDVVYGNGETEHLKGRRRNFHKAMYTLHASIGYQFPLSERLNFNIEAFSSQYMHRMNAPKAYLINSGLKLGINF